MIGCCSCGDGVRAVLCCSARPVLSLVSLSMAWQKAFVTLFSSVFGIPLLGLDLGGEFSCPGLKSPA